MSQLLKVADPLLFQILQYITWGVQLRSIKGQLIIFYKDINIYTLPVPHEHRVKTPVLTDC